jgi:glycosyltransferase involved in cell wall biosynthesis
MRLRVINYAAGSGGIPRFICETLRAILLARPGLDVEFVSYGHAYEQFSGLFRAQGLNVRCVAVRPEQYAVTAPRRILGLRGSGRITIGMAGLLTRWGYRVPAAALKGCDVAWFPLLHTHWLPRRLGVPSVATIHDLTLLGRLSGRSEGICRSERAIVESALRTATCFTTGSRATVADLGDNFRFNSGRFRVVPLSGAHPRGLGDRASGPALGPFYFCPANILPHKNHALLFEAFSRARASNCRLVLTGGNANLPRTVPGCLRLRRLARRRGLRVGTDILALGYVSDSEYYRLLAHARAVIMPTLAEGGGSFPVEEAVLAGVPVLCSDIPVMREHMERIGAEVLWFDPRDAASLCAALEMLEEEFPALKARARAQTSRLTTRSWAQVAGDYLNVFDAAIAGHPAVEQEENARPNC